MRTDNPREVIEAALAHVVQNRVEAVEAACARSDLFKRQRALMMYNWAGKPSQGRGEDWEP